MHLQDGICAQYIQQTDISTKYTDGVTYAQTHAVAGLKVESGILTVRKKVEIRRRKEGMN